MGATDLTRLGTINPLTPPKRGWQMKKLGQKHKTIVALHLQHIKREEIAAVVGCTPEYVSMVVAQPLAQAYMREVEGYMDSRLRSLYSKSIDAIHNGLNDGDPEVALKAARLQMEATGKLGGSAEKEQSAEDVVAQILAQVNVTVNMNGGDHAASGRVVCESPSPASSAGEE